MTPRRIQLSRAKGWRLPEDAVNCARPGPWGNPFKVGRDGTRAECVTLYKRLLAGFICLREPPPFEAQETARNYVITHREELRGKDLACWCRLDGKPCHADVLLKVANT